MKKQIIPLKPQLFKADITLKRFWALISLGNLIIHSIHL